MQRPKLTLWRCRIYRTDAKAPIKAHNLGLNSTLPAWLVVATFIPLDWISLSDKLVALNFVRFASITEHPSRSPSLLRTGVRLGSWLPAWQARRNIDRNFQRSVQENSN
ncbi:MAG TPA: hypothetical protein VIK69_08630 [Methylophilaceae bacterium]